MKKQADICLILEGTYPYVSGGVSTWVHQLIKANPDLSFAIFHIGALRGARMESKYDIPKNVTGIEDMFLFEREGGLRLLPPTSLKSAAKLHEEIITLFKRGLSGSREEFNLLVPLVHDISKSWTADFDAFWRSKETWHALTEICRHHASEESFLHFYWTCRYLIEPLWKLARAIPRVPRAAVYHTACTGYAGFLGAVLTRETGAPLLLSEHGIYLRERIQDICHSRWIPEFPVLRPSVREPLGALRQLWISFFEVIGRFCYNESARIVSLFGKNASVQRHFGAAAEKISLIPNGIATESFDQAAAQRDARRAGEGPHHTVGFLGRVVSIKDVKTLLRAARLVCDRLPEAKFLIIGPTDEEPEYFAQCTELSSQLELHNSVIFPGPQSPLKAMPQMDVMVLTSVSEGLPFVVLEALAAGVPIVSTDVGACRELLQHREDQPDAADACGLITEAGNASQIASALVQLLTDHTMNHAMGEAGRRRVRLHYHEKQALGAYRDLYESLIQSSPAAAA